MNGAGGLSYGRYETSDHREWLMRIGPLDAPAILFVPPLLEEMNRTRALIASVMRGLAVRGYACSLPDLPGTGESERALESCSWDDWRRAIADAAPRPLAVASFRGGALLDDAAGAPVWRFAPAEGNSLARDLIRAGMLKPEALKSAQIELAGYRVSETLFAALSDARPAAAARQRVVRLASDRGDADLKVEGPALWRRSEPTNSPDLAISLADDLTNWCERCAAS